MAPAGPAEGAQEAREAQEAQEVLPAEVQRAARHWRLERRAAPATVPGMGSAARCGGEERRPWEALLRRPAGLLAAGFRRGAAPASAALECCRGSGWGGGERVYV